MLTPLNGGTAHHFFPKLPKPRCPSELYRSQRRVPSPLSSYLFLHPPPPLGDFLARPCAAGAELKRPAVNLGCSDNAMDVLMSFSILRTSLPCSGVARVMAWPSCPALPVRPIRWT